MRPAKLQRYEFTASRKTNIDVTDENSSTVLTGKSKTGMIMVLTSDGVL